MCLMSVALALVFPVAVKCCPGSIAVFQKVVIGLLSLGSVVIRHSLHVMSLGAGLSQDVHEQCYFWLHGVISVLVRCVSHMMTLNLKLSPVVNHTESRCVCAIQAEWGWHTSLKDEGGGEIDIDL